jgi:hypothetical protein
MIPILRGDTVTDPQLDANETDPATLWAEIWRLRHDAEGPDGYDTWKDAAVAERVRRVKAERALAEAQPKMPQWPQRPPPVSLRQRFAAWRERTGFLMDGRDGAM